MYQEFFHPVSKILSIKESTNKALHRLGIDNLRDLLFFRPYSYNIIDNSPDLSKLHHNKLIQAEIIIGEVQVGRGRSPTKIYVHNDSGEMILVFFNKIPPFIFKKLVLGAKITISGKVQYFNGIYQITHPDFIFDKLQRQAGIEPIYHLTYGLLNRQLHGYILKAIKHIEQSINLYLSQLTNDDVSNILTSEMAYLESLIRAIKHTHLVGVAPIAGEIEKAISGSRANLAFKELLAYQLSLDVLRKTRDNNRGSIMPPTDDKMEVLDHLGFELTSAQNHAISEIEQDQNSTKQMMRLLQGDVGSGKTIVALLTMLNAVKAGTQAVLMAPTDLLSLQHYNFFCKALANQDLKIDILTGKTKPKEKKRIKQDLADGKIDILIGTHALFQDDVEFHKLGYVVIDEQHRFGVNQRMGLIKKASHPDVLVMTATPIPRSLSLTIFGDMEVSIIDGKPKDRLPIVTSSSPTGRKSDIIKSIKTRIDQGEAVYWICSLVEQSDPCDEAQTGLTRMDSQTMYQELEREYPGRVGLLHGKMPAASKDEIMQKFKQREIDILVATTVVEVGIDIPHATLIIIENAESFGLAQLHQLRGRVGRGHRQSYCILLYEPKFFSKIARKRIEVMRGSEDGFFIAEQDLLLRGGGEILGTKQSGEVEFFFVDLSIDRASLEKANKIAPQLPKSRLMEFQKRLFSKEKDNAGVC